MAKTGRRTLEILRIVFPQHVNPAQRLYGGRLMYWICEAGTLAASRHQRGPVVLGAMEDIDILKGVRSGDRVAFNVRVQASFGASMDVRVEVTRTKPDESEAALTCTAHLTFVAIGDDGRPTAAVAVVPGTEAEERAHSRAVGRRERRLARLAEGGEARWAGKFTAPATAEALRLVTPDMMLGDKVFAGEVLFALDEVAAIASHRYSHLPAVTASVDAVDFHHPIRAGEVMAFRAAVNHVGHTSMEIGVWVGAENPFTGEVKRVCTAFATFVALGPDGRPVAVPPFVPGSPQERERFRAAEERQRTRMARIGR
ncbi:acyl-CoA thioesterase [bacterium]|nr:acyl-CoA thioesterase [bacterium]